MIGFYTKFTTSENDRSALVKLLSAAAAAMRKIAACRIYIVSEDAHDVAATWVTEVWTTKEAHEKSIETESAKQLIASALPLLADGPEQTELAVVAGKGL